jgi:general secretion pathway protein K
MDLPFKRSENGSVLIIVLVLMLVSISLALYAVSLSRDMVATSQQLLDKLQAKVDSSNVMEKTIYIGTTGRFSSWSIDNMSANSGFPLRINLRSTPFMVGSSQVRLQDSAGRLGLWSLNSEYLKGMLYRGGLKPAEIETAADSLVDWTDEDDLKQLNGAESYFYSSEQSRKYLPRNDHFIQTVDELALVKGWRGAALDIVRSEIMQGASSSFNINTADATLLSGVLDISLEAAGQLVQLREKNGLISASDLFVIAPNALTKMPEYNINFPSLTVGIDIRTNIGVSADLQRAVIRFGQSKDRPYTVETFEE